MLKKIFNSRILRVLVSVVLIYFAFRKVNVAELWGNLVGVKWWFVVLNIIISLIGVMLISFRWSNLLIKRPKIKDILVFTKSSLVASFYGLFFPTSMAADLLKWVIIDEKYPDIPKTKLLGSVVLDRFIGMSMFIFVGLAMVLFGEIDKNMIPFWIKLTFIGLFLFCFFFYLSLYFFDLSKIFKIKFLSKFENVSGLIEKSNVKQVFKSVGISLMSEFLWVWQMWFISWYFKTGLSIVSIFVFIPIISMILALPISFAGFGAREQLYMLFFSGLATSTESILLTSTFAGILGILIALIGGLVSLTPDFKKSINKHKQ
jgi:uncharacterized membrane protein YbhN (UPF0104 family)